MFSSMYLYIIGINIKNHHQKNMFFIYERQVMDKLGQNYRKKNYWFYNFNINSQSKQIHTAIVYKIFTCVCIGVIML